MVEIMVEVPDNLAARLARVKDQLPEILELMTSEGLPLSAQVYDEVLEFLASNPAPHEIVAFRLSLDSQDQINQLQDRHNEGTITAFEKAELQRLLKVENLMRAIKLQALEESNRKNDNG